MVLMQIYLCVLLNPEVPVRRRHEGRLTSAENIIVGEKILNKGSLYREHSLKSGQNSHDQLFLSPNVVK
jgi:hypothetical protein